MNILNKSASKIPYSCLIIVIFLDLGDDQNQPPVDDHDRPLIGGQGQSPAAEGRETVQSPVTATKAVPSILPPRIKIHSSISFSDIEYLINKKVTNKDKNSV